MSACHEKVAANMFLESGAKHVIGIEEKVKDAARVMFTKTFYNKLWMAESKICACFRSAQLAVEVKYGREQSTFFKLFKHPKNE